LQQRSAPKSRVSGNATSEIPEFPRRPAVLGNYNPLLFLDQRSGRFRQHDTVLGGLADVERDLIRRRTAEGGSRAKARGQHMSRPPKLTPQQQKEARRRRAEGETLKVLAKTYNVGKSTISRLG